MGRAIFVSFEGLDGAGKTTQIKMLHKYLEDLGRNVRVFREPGGTGLGEQIREALLHGDDVVPWAEASLFAAARAQLVELEIRPALLAGIDVICDRYVDSSLAYQGWGRGLDVDLIERWNQAVTGELVPDKTFLLSLPAEDVTPRLDEQLELLPRANAAPKLQLPSSDRLERESVVFRARIDSGYRALARGDSGRVLELDARKKRAVIARDIQSVIANLLEQPSGPSESVREAAIDGPAPRVH